MYTYMHTIIWPVMKKNTFSRQNKSKSEEMRQFNWHKISECQTKPKLTCNYVYFFVKAALMLLEIVTYLLLQTGKVIHREASCLKHYNVVVFKQHYFKYIVPGLTNF